MMNPIVRLTRDDNKLVNLLKIHRLKNYEVGSTLLESQSLTITFSHSKNAASFLVTYISQPNLSG